MKKISLTNNATTRFIIESYQELIKVTWPTRNEVFRKTLTVVLVMIIGAAILAAFDYGLTAGVRAIIDMKK